MTLMFTQPGTACIDGGATQTVQLVFHIEQPAPQASTLQYQVDLPLVQCEEVTPTPTETGIVEVETPTSTLTPIPTATLSAQVQPLVVTPAATLTPVPTRPIAEVQGTQFVPPVTGDAGLIGRIGLDTGSSDGAGGGRVLLAAVLLLVLFGTVAAGVQMSKIRIGRQ
jgi:hypothetical protein